MKPGDLAQILWADDSWNRRTALGAPMNIRAYNPDGKMVHIKPKDLVVFLESDSDSCCHEFLHPEHGVVQVSDTILLVPVSTTTTTTRSNDDDGNNAD